MLYGADNNKKVSLKNCAPFRKCRAEINETHIDEGTHINIAMPMCNLIEYNDNYSNTSGSLWQFKRDEIEEDVDLAVNYNHIPNNLSSFKYKSSLITNRNGVKIAVPVKYLSNFWRLLEMPLINCKVELLLTWDPNCVLCTLAGASTFTITDAKLYVPIVTLSTEDNAKLSKLLTEGFKRSVYWNKYSVIAEKSFNANVLIRESVDSNCQGINRLFVLAYKDGDNRITANSHRRYFLPRIEIRNYNIEIDGRNFYGESINNQETNDLMKQYEESRKISTGQGDDYAIVCVLDFAYFKENYRLIAADLGKQKALDADPRPIQQIIFTGKVDQAAAVY